jgi:serine/threonine protein kinase/class 3 adenylate cyclase
MPELKTFLFTDIVGSVELKRQMPGHSDAERDRAFIDSVLRPHRERIERELTAHSGRVVSTAGDGHFLVFADTILAARWAIGIQKSHRDEPIAALPDGAVAVRIAMHLGIPQVDPHDPDNFVGKPIDYAARLSDYATGGQILVSRSVVAVLEDAGMDGVRFHRHGSQDLKGIGRVEVYELVYEGQGPRKVRSQPRESLSRQWTVLPATMGLTEFHAGRTASRAAESALAATDVVPLRLGNYELEERLGSGGMGDVYRARHAQFGRLRAVKIIKQHFVDSGHREVIRRFYQEIKAVGQLDHPNIVVAIDSSAPADSVHYLVMEYIDGIGADALVARHGPLPVAEACEIARQAARGLAYIQQHGMVHRDIKPSNLMLTVVRGDALGSGSSAEDQPETEQAVVKILDLGLALLVGDDQQRLTLLDNRAMGTAMYMSPEQWKTTSVDIRADIYSLGCTLYHLLAGKPPFWESDLRPEKAHEREKLPPIDSAQPIPRALWELLTRMTAKNRDERIADPAAVAAELAPLAEGHQLARLVRSVVPRPGGELTQGFSKSDTRLAKSAESDTRLVSPTISRGFSKSFPPLPSRIIRRAVLAVGGLAAVAAIAFLIITATGGRQQTREVRQHLLQVAANSAASEIRSEIDQRFRYLSRVAQDPFLQEAMVRIDDAPGDEALWQPLRDWLSARKLDADSQALSSESWFINDRQGVQVARSPRSNDSLGNNYSHRDYFHGRGTDLPEGSGDLEPISGPHLSAVYRSTTTRQFKVAFSVPIENGRSGAARKVVGVLAMSVDLGEFNVLENVLDRQRGQEVVLIDLRRDNIEGDLLRGLILHHLRNETFHEARPPRLHVELLERIDRIQADSAAAQSRSNLLLNYRDPLSEDGRRTYWGAVERVILTGPDGERLDTGWLVLVQEPALR